jgi:hypothetical protein
MTMHRAALALTVVNLVLLLALSGQGRTAAQPTVPVLRAQVLELVDEHGRLRSRLNVEPSGEVVLRLTDQHGTIRVKLGAGEDGSGLLLANHATEPGVHLLATSAGTSVTLADQGGRQLLLTPRQP